MNVRTALVAWSLIGMVGLATGFSPVVAQNGTPSPEGPILPADATVAGLGLAEWSARSWQWDTSLPEAVNPFLDETGARCGYGQSGPVFFLSVAERSVDRACTVPLGAHLFVPLLGSACSTVESPPFFGRDAADLTGCATAALDVTERAFDMAAMRLVVDGQDTGDLAAYRAVTPLFTLWLPEGNVLGVPMGAADSVAAGYQVLLRPLPVGEHAVAISLPGEQPGERVTISYRLTVVSGAYAEASESLTASPPA